MKNSFALQALIDLAQTRTDDAAKRLATLLSTEQEGHNKLALLAQYRDEYQQRFMDAARTGISREEWHNYNLFLDRLDQAVEHQQKVVDVSRQRTAAGQEDWRHQRNRLKAFDTLSQRQAQAAQAQEAKREQKQLDEHSAKLFASQGGEGN